MKVVLDTNVVLDLVVFHEPGAAPLLNAIESGRATVLARLDCLDELRRVLAYPRFRLDAAAQATALQWLVNRAELATAESPSVVLPRCRDADDQKFLELAWTTQADFLVTKDNALLVLARRIAKLGRFTVSLPTDLPLRSG